MTRLRFLLLIAVWSAFVVESAITRIAPASRTSLAPHGRRQALPSSPFDHSYIKSWASLGDSFAAGIGAGTRLTGWGDWYCSRYDASYPSVINTSPSLGDSTGRTFQYYACSGAITTDVINSQIPSLTEPLPQMVTLTIGGNDANLADILHACIYQWNKDPTLDCDATLAASQAAIDAPSFASNFNSLLNALKPKLADANSKIYWTGYAHFWDTTTNECDGVTWAFKYNIGNRQYLTQARRNTMNGLVDAVNQKIQDAINSFGSQAIYVPWEADVDFITGHYCEPGVDEWNAVNREQTAFYEWGSDLDDLSQPSDSDELRKRQASGFLTARQTVNNTGQAPGVLTAGQNLNDTFEGQIAAWVLDAINQGATPEDFGLTSPDVVQAQGGLLLPDTYGRIFHPQQFGHLMIAEAILRTMDSVQAKLIGQSAATTTLIGCPVPTGPASHTGEHDQCYSDTTQPDQTTFAVAAADAAIKTYCLKHQSQTVTAGNGIMDQVPNGADASTSLILQASLDTESACVNYPNLGQWNYFDCSNNLGSAMNDCDLSTTTQKNGGSRTADCITYSIRASTSGTYVPGTCSFHLTETEDCNTDQSQNLYGIVTMYDDAKNVIGQTVVNSSDPIGIAMDDGNSYSFQSNLPDALVITGEHQGDYVQFTIGALSWQSTNPNGGASCSVGGWNPRAGPTCGLRAGNQNAVKNMDCSFPYSG